MERWEGKVAIVTGASSGIGEAIAKDLVKHGLQVVGLARRADRLDAIASTVDTSRGTFHPFTCDLTSEESILSAFAFAKSIGPIHILINNAGLFIAGGLVDGDTDSWRRTVDVNVLGLCVATREAVKDMRENGVDGHIVHMNSIGGHKCVPGPFNLYAATKHAVTALTETLRLELNGLGLKIKVSSVSPGYVKTEIFSAAGWENHEEVFEGAPALTSEDVSEAVMYVLGTPPHVQVHELTVKPVGEIF